MFKKRRVGNLSNPSLNLKTCHSIGLVTDLNEHEQEIISGYGGRDDMWAFEVKSSEKQKPWLHSNFKVELG
jgi:hypothetical protein